MSLITISINASKRFALFLYFFVILSYTPCSTMMMPGNLLDVDPCDTCKKISEKFIEGYRKTSRSNFGGGNTEWEEKKLKGYAKSETRLIEIMEGACSKTESQCGTFLEKYEDQIDEWYQATSPELIDTFYQWLCIDTAKVCCPAGTFGKNCRRCHYGDNGRVCTGNGDCDGDGTRSGNGRCICNAKYKGTYCSNCQDGYTKSIDNNNEVICTDIDECRASILLSPCVFRKCNNTDGGYECYGEPFYNDITKLTTLAAFLITISILMYKEIYGLASFSCVVTVVLLVLFAKNIL